MSPHQETILNLVPGATAKSSEPALLSVCSHPRDRTAGRMTTGMGPPSTGNRSSACFVRRAKALFSSGCESRPATFAPAGSNWSSRGGNEAAEASGVEGH